MVLSQRRKGILAIILLAAIWGTMGIFARYLNTGFTLYQQVYLRLLAAAISCLFFFGQKIRFSTFVRLKPREWLLVTARGLLYYTAGVSLYSLSVITTKLSNAVFIDSIPVTALLGIILLHEKINIRKMFYVMLALFGVLIIGVKDFNNLFDWGRGEMLMFVSVWCTSLSMVARKWHDNSLNNQEMSFLILLVGAFGAFILSVINGDTLPVSDWSAGLLLAIILSGIANTFITFLINYGFERIDAIFGSNLLTLQTLFAIIFGFIVYREVPLAKELAGGIIITLSAIQMNKISGDKKR